MQLIFKEIKDDNDIKELARLAQKIWNTYYPSIIEQQQIDYMLGQMYLFPSLREQITDKKNVFTGAYQNEEMVGFISHSRTGEKDYFIHKLYVNTELHRKGIGRALYCHAFKNKDISTIRLTVNRQNYKSVNFYFRLGFFIENIIDIEIGEGYVMNDFLMILQK